MLDKQDPKYDAFLLVSFGGPEGMNDVMPFLQNVLRGKNVPGERVIAVAHHYELFGGVSPINAENRKLIAALRPIIELDGPKLPIYWGNRNWHPLLADTIKQMAADGIKRAIAFVTAAYSSYSSCRQYLEDIDNACLMIGAKAPQIDKIRPFYNHPNFIIANAEQLLIAQGNMPAERQRAALIIFTAHSIPLSMADGCRYAEQLQETCKLIMTAAKLSNPWQISYQSRSGSPKQPWLEPDLNKTIETLPQNNVKDVIIAPVGFISEHMEILYDLDVQTKQLCEELNIGYNRAKTAGSRPQFVSMIKLLVDEQLARLPFNQESGDSKSSNEFCFSNCCPIG